MEKDFTVKDLKDEVKDLSDDILVYVIDSEGNKCSVPDFYVDENDDYIYIATASIGCYPTVNIKYIKNFVKNYSDSMHIYTLSNDDCEMIQGIECWKMDKKHKEFVIYMM